MMMSTLSVEKPVRVTLVYARTYDTWGGGREGAGAAAGGAGDGAGRGGLGATGRAATL